MGPYTARALAAALAQLDDLSGWDELQALGERVANALRGQEGLSKRDMERLARWPRRWASVSKHVRRFYRRVLAVPTLTDPDRAAIYRGLIAILDAREPGSWARAHLSRLHREELGTDAGLDLAPVTLHHHHKGKPR